MNQYPANKIKALNAYMLNFNKDIASLNNIVDQMKAWCQRGIAVDSALAPLQEQIKTWEATMCTQLMSFKTNLVMLKELDDRVRSSINIDLEVTHEYDILALSSNNDVMGSWDKLYLTYSNLFTNLNEDVVVLTNAHTTIVGYKNLGIELTTAVTTIETHIEKINLGISASLADLDSIVDNLKAVSMLVLSVEEINARHDVLPELKVSHKGSQVSSTTVVHVEPVNPVVPLDAVESTDVSSVDNHSTDDDTDPLSTK